MTIRRISWVTVFLLSVVFLGNLDWGYSSSNVKFPPSKPIGAERIVIVQTPPVAEEPPQKNEDPEVVFKAYALLMQNFHDPALLKHVELFNAALGGLNNEARRLGSNFIADKLLSDASLEDAQAHFSKELNRAKNNIDSKLRDNEHQLAFASLDSMLDSLKDSHTGLELYIPKEKLGGIGVSLKKLEDNFYYIDQIFFASPAYAGGLQKFDRLVAVNGAPLPNDLGKISMLIRGPQDSLIEITVERNGHNITFLLSRDYIMQLGNHRIIEHGGFPISYMDFRSFDLIRGAYEICDGIEEARVKKAKGIILDLRGNAGGSVLAMKAVLGCFLEKGRPIFAQKDRKGRLIVRLGGEEDWLYRYAKKCYSDLPLVILVDDNSFSASEITSYALKHHRRATLIGKRTGGAVGIGRSFQLLYDRKIVITCAEALTLDDGLLENVGVKPDIIVELTKENIVAGRDRQLEEALNFLTRAK